MKVTQFYVSYKEDAKGKHHIRGHVDVPGLGNVEISDCVSEQTLRTIEIEVCQALRVRFGQLPDNPAIPKHSGPECP